MCDIVRKPYLTVIQREELVADVICGSAVKTKEMVIRLQAARCCLIKPTVSLATPKRTSATRLWKQLWPPSKVGTTPQVTVLPSSSQDIPQRWRILCGPMPGWNREWRRNLSSLIKPPLNRYTFCWNLQLRRGFLSLCVFVDSPKTDNLRKISTFVFTKKCICCNKTRH